MILCHCCRLPELEAQSDNGLNDGDSWSTGSNESKTCEWSRNYNKFARRIITSSGAEHPVRLWPDHFFAMLMRNYY